MVSAPVDRLDVLISSAIHVFILLVCMFPSQGIEIFLTNCSQDGSDGIVFRTR